MNPDLPTTLLPVSRPVALRLKPDRHFPFLARHPWVHAHAMAEEGAELPCGQVIELLDHDGNWIARGVINPASRLRVRLYSFDAAVGVDEQLWTRRIDGALARRRLLGPFDPDGAERLIFSESDLMSGLIVDRYADCLGVQFTSAGLLKWREPILQHLQAATGARAIMVRMDDKTARYEGVEPLQEWHGGVELSAPVPFRQNGLQLSVDLRSGQKTGSYLDQRCNHVAVAQYLVGRRVLDVCSYTGGFGLVASKAGAASILAVDSSVVAVQEGRRAAERNEIHNVEFMVGDCFDSLEKLRKDGEQFGGVILDPPRFAGSRHEIERALRAYGRLNSLAVDLLPPGGILATCSCSGRVSRTDFLNMLVDVARRRHRDLIVLEQRGPAPDHPMAISCPESDYLKCVIAQVC